MDLRRNVMRTTLMLALMAPTAALAQNQPVPEDTDGYEHVAGENNQPQNQERIVIGEGSPSEALPPPQSDTDPAPPVAAPAPAEHGLTAQAGVGGTQAYGRAGVLELGGGLGFAAASEFTQFSVTPSVGYFLVDNFQLSGLTGLHYIRAGGDDSSFLTLLIEPSIHIPFSQQVFGFAGVGTGVSYAQDPGAGFALAPRVGMNVMVGRSGILTPAVQMIWSTSDAIQTPQGTIIAVNTSFGANLNYTVMW